MEADLAESNLSTPPILGGSREWQGGHPPWSPDGTWRRVAVTGCVEFQVGHWNLVCSWGGPGSSSDTCASLVLETPVLGGVGRLPA